MTGALSDMANASWSRSFPIWWSPVGQSGDSEREQAQIGNGVKRFTISSIRRFLGETALFQVAEQGGIQLLATSQRSELRRRDAQTVAPRV